MSILDYRYELKYALAPADAFRIEGVILSHPAGFKKAYNDRLVNNIYFDDSSYSACNDNLSGIAERTKIRYRWYGESTNPTEGVIEYKIKKNALGTKAYHRDIAFNSLDELSDIVNAKVSPGIGLLPTLRNQYLRTYFIDQSERFRLTIDRNIKYAWPEELIGDSLTPLSDDRIIVEVKFDKNSEMDIDNITHYIPYRITKHSKYLSGLNALYG
jgi:SPX domain protein involved in polyphosphate accumulation